MSVAMAVVSWIVLQVERVWSRAHRLWQAWKGKQLLSEGYTREPRFLPRSELLEALRRERRNARIHARNG